MGDLHRVGDGAGQAGQRHGRLRPHPLHSHPAVLAALPEVSVPTPSFSHFRLVMGHVLSFTVYQYKFSPRLAAILTIKSSC